jgi:hypothetical protein
VQGARHRLADLGYRLRAGGSPIHACFNDANGGGRPTSHLMKAIRCALFFNDTGGKMIATVFCCPGSRGCGAGTPALDAVSRRDWKGWVLIRRKARRPSPVLIRLVAGAATARLSFAAGTYEGEGKVKILC